MADRPAISESIGPVLEPTSIPEATRLAIKDGKTKFLQNSLGEQTNFFAKFANRCLLIYDLPTSELVYRTTLRGNIVDLDFLPQADGGFGLIVAVRDVNSETPDYVSLIVPKQGSEDQLRVIASVAVAHEIKVVKTVLSDEDVANSTNLVLNDRLSTWKNIVAIGTKKCHCYLLEIEPLDGDADQKENGESAAVDEQDDDEEKAKPVPMQFDPHMADLLKRIVKNGRLEYECEDDTYNTAIASAVTVTAIAFLPRSRSVLIGLSTGGIVAATLNPSNQLMMRMLYVPNAVRHLATMEPEDDPDKHEWFFVGYDASPRHKILIALVQGGFKSDANFPGELRFDNPQFSPKFAHEIPLGTRWISLRTLAHERSVHDGRRGPYGGGLDESTFNSTFNTSVLAHGSNRNRSIVAFSYEKLEMQDGKRAPELSRVAGGIFDVNLYYYKRFPPGLMSDRTLLKQCPYLSWFHSNRRAHEVEDVTFVTSSSRDLTQFKSAISDADQLFYPSANTYEQVYIVENSVLRSMRVTSLQEKVLDRIADILTQCLKAPKAAAELLKASGILPANTQISPNRPNNVTVNDDESAVLRAMTHAGRIDQMLATISGIGFDHEHLRRIAQWAWQEAVDFRGIILDRIHLLMDGDMTNLSPAAFGTLSHGVGLFYNLQRVIAAAAVRECNDSRRNEFGKLGRAVRCMYLHTRLTRNCIRWGVVPLATNTQREMVNNHNAMKMEAAKFGKRLPVEELLRKLYEKTEGEAFWMGKDWKEWYPPPMMNLMEPVLNIGLEDRIKRELLVYYSLDWLHVAMRIDRTDKEKMVSCVQSVLDDKMFGLDDEKIMFLLNTLDKAMQPDFEEPKPSTSALQSVLNKSRKTFLDDDDLSLEDPLSKQEMAALQKRQHFDPRDFDPAKMGEEEKEHKRRVLLHLYSQQRYAEIKDVFFDHKNKDREDAFNVLKHLVVAPGKKDASTANGDPLEDAKAAERVAAVRAMVSRSTTCAGGPVVDATGVFGGFGYGRSLGQPATTRKRGIVDVIPDDGEATSRKDKRKTIARDPEENQEPSRPRSASRPNVQPLSQTRLDVSDPSMSPMENDTLAQEIQTVVRTPARFLRRPQQLRADEMSPTGRPAVVRAPTSILKSAKHEMTPSRGHIRFNLSPEVEDDEPVVVPKFDLTEANEVDDDEDERPVTWSRQVPLKSSEAGPNSQAAVSATHEVQEDEDVSDEEMGGTHQEQKSEISEESIQSFGSCVEVEDQELPANFVDDSAESAASFAVLEDGSDGSAQDVKGVVTHEVQQEEPVEDECGDELADDDVKESSPTAAFVRTEEVQEEVEDGDGELGGDEVKVEEDDEKDKSKGEEEELKEEEEGEEEVNENGDNEEETARKHQSRSLRKTSEVNFTVYVDKDGFERSFEEQRETDLEPIAEDDEDEDVVVVKPAPTPSMPLRRSTRSRTPSVVGDAADCGAKTEHEKSARRTVSRETTPLETIDEAPQAQEQQKPLSEKRGPGRPRKDSTVAASSATPGRRASSVVTTSTKNRATSEVNDTTVAIGSRSTRRASSVVPTPSAKRASSRSRESTTSPAKELKRAATTTSTIKKKKTLDVDAALDDALDEIKKEYGETRGRRTTTTLAVGTNRQKEAAATSTRRPTRAASVAVEDGNETTASRGRQRLTSEQPPKSTTTTTTPPRKNQRNNSKTPEKATTTTTTTPSRGRKRLFSEQPTTVAKTPSKATKTSPSKGRKRVNSETVTTTKTPKKEAETPKRGRGRPPKDKSTEPEATVPAKRSKWLEDLEKDLDDEPVIRHGGKATKRAETTDAMASAASPARSTRSRTTSTSSNTGLETPSTRSRRATTAVQLPPIEEA